MASILNAVFGPIVATCADSGGEIVDFAGDALLVVWRAEPAAMSEAAQAATQCALELQHLVQSQPPMDETEIAVKISLTAGPVHVLHVGGIGGRKHSVVVGGPIERLAEVEMDVESGAVVVGPEIAALLGDRFERSTTPAGNTRVEALDFEIPTRPIELPLLDPKRRRLSTSTSPTSSPAASMPARTSGSPSTGDPPRYSST